MPEKQGQLVNPQEAAEYLRLSLARLGELGLPVTAENYSLFYIYYSGRSEELKRLMDEMFAAGETLSPQLVEDFFSRYVCQCHGLDLEALNQELLQAMAQILGALLEFAGQAALSNQSLETHLNDMAQTDDPREILRIATEIVAYTRQFVKNTRVLEEGIQETTTQIEILQEELTLARQEASIDALTGLHNRRDLDKTLQASLDKASQDKKPVCLLMIDIDHFKSINDTHGHLIGDKVLVSVAKLLSTQLRGGDYIARFGGEEFIVVLQDTSITGAFSVAEKIRTSVERLRLKQVKTGKSLDPINVSIGVACFRDGETMMDLIGRCDKALYRAKQSGRNRSLIAE